MNNIIFSRLDIFCSVLFSIELPKINIKFPSVISRLQFPIKYLKQIQDAILTYVRIYKSRIKGKKKNCFYFYHFIF